MTTLVYIMVLYYGEDFRFFKVYSLFHVNFILFYILKFTDISNFPQKNLIFFMSCNRHMTSSLKTKYKIFLSCLVAKWQVTE